MNSFASLKRGVVTLLLAAAGLTPAAAQQVAHSPSGTQPAPGVTMVRQQVRYLRFAGDADAIKAQTILAHGITSDFTLMVHLPVVAYAGEAIPDEAGLGDIQVMGQFRFLRRDTGPLDTTRATAQFGIEIPTFDEPFSSDSFDPFLGVAVTQIRGRHGLGAHLRYKFNTGSQSMPLLPGDSEHDALLHDASYVYRLIPERFSLAGEAGTYLVLEANGIYETNGDYSLWFSPGVMIEAANWTVEAAVRLPIYEAVDERPELRWGFTLGLRYLF